MLPLFLCCFYPILFILAGDDDMHESSEEFEICQIRLLTAELAALERLKKPHRLIIGKLVLPRFLSYA